MIDKLNDILATTDQTLRFKFASKHLITLTNDLTLTDEAEVRRCMRRVLRKSKVFLAYFDLVYNIDRNIREDYEKIARSQTSVAGGLRCQEKHSEKIKNNLNTGVPWNKGTKGSYPYESWCKGKSKDTDERLRMLSEARTGEGNPMYGVKHTEEYKKYKSDLMKSKILNGEFTPNSNNRNTHWDSYYNGKKYRSSWEALYQYLDPSAEYERLRIEYEYNGKIQIYIVDFINYDTRNVIEVKPVEHQTGDQYASKMKALTHWANINKFEVIVFDQTMFANLPDLDYTNFDTNTSRKIQYIYETYKQN